MKRVIAAILALMLLLSAGALAEKNAAVMTLDNVCLQDKTHTVKVRDYAVSLVLENINDLPSLALRMQPRTRPTALHQAADILKAYVKKAIVRGEEAV